MKTRAEVAAFINSGELVHSCTFEKQNQHHFGKVELRALMDFIYQDKKPSESELINRISFAGFKG